MSASCDHPGLLAQGRVIGSDYSHGQIVKYECITHGYSLVGKPQLTCKDGRWDSKRPVCKGKEYLAFYIYIIHTKVNTNYVKLLARLPLI